MVGVETEVRMSLASTLNERTMLNEQDLRLWPGLGQLNADSSGQML
jgi:hypothetical protein